MKKTILFSIILIFVTQLFSVTEIDNFLNLKERYTLLNDIPAVRAYDKSSYFVFPLISSNINFTNTLINYNNLNIFYEDHFITDNEKKLLTKNDLKIFLTYKTPILKMGIKNFGMDMSFYTTTKATILDKQLTKLVLYGNDKDKYTLHNGKNSILYTFGKLKFYYAYDKPIKLSFIPSLKTDYPFLNNTVEYIRNLPLYFGANLNFYKPIVYGEVLDAEQNFGTNISESYANYKLDIIYTDISEGKYKRKTTAGLGFSIAGDLKRGYFYMDLDDIFGGIKFDNLTEKIFQGTFQDSLTHFQSEYETVNNDTIIEKTRNRYKSISADFTIGAEYDVYKGVYATFEYRNSKYKYPDGISIGARKTFLTILPLGFKIGYDNIMNYQLLAGLYFTNLEFYVKFTTFGGFFNYANGTGLSFNWIHRFQ